MFLLWNFYELPAVRSGRVSAARPREINLQPGDTATFRVGIHINAFPETLQQELQRLRQQQQQQQHQQQQLRQQTQPHHDEATPTAESATGAPTTVPQPQ